MDFYSQSALRRKGELSVDLLKICCMRRSRFYKAFLPPQLRSLTFVPDVGCSSQRGWSFWLWMPPGTQPASSESLSLCASRQCASRQCASRQCASREFATRECASGSVILGSVLLGSVLQGV